MKRASEDRNSSTTSISVLHCRGARIWTGTGRTVSTHFALSKDDEGAVFGESPSNHLPEIAPLHRLGFNHIHPIAKFKGEDLWPKSVKTCSHIARAG